MNRLCNFYINVKDLSNDETKLFTCDCKQHKGRDIQVVKIDGVVRELSFATLNNQRKEDGTE